MNELANQAARGDRDAMTRIVTEHYPFVIRFCARRIGSQVAEDAAQETFLVAWRTIRKFDHRSSFRTWLLGIAHNVCRNLARKRKIEMTYEHAWTERLPDAPTPENTSVDRIALRHSLTKLTAEQREVVVMHELEGLSYEETATILEIPVGTVKSRLNAAFQRLRQLLCVEAGR